MTATTRNEIIAHDTASHQVYPRAAAKAKLQATSALERTSLANWENKEVSFRFYRI